MRVDEFKRLLGALDEQLAGHRLSARQARAILAELDGADEATLAELVRDLLHVLKSDDYGLALEGLVVSGRNPWIPLHGIAFGEDSVHRGWIVDIAAASTTGISVKIEWQPTDDDRAGHTPQLALRQLDVLRGSGRGAQAWLPEERTFRGTADLPPPVPQEPGDTLAARDGAANAGEETIHRTPHVDAGEYNDAPVPVETTFPVRVYLDTSAVQPGEEGEPVELPNQQLRLTVNLTVSSHFTINGLSSAQIVVDPAEAQSSEATFSITCQRADPGRAGIAAILFHEWRPVGDVSRRLTVAGSEPIAVQPIMSAPATDPGGVVEIHPGAIAPADLTITVRRAPDGDERHYAVTVCSPHLKRLVDGVTVAWNLPSATRDMVEAMMGDFLTRDPGGRVAALRGAGIEMFSATPQGFQDAFWELLDHARAENIDLKTIYVVTDEPHIPWELMMPARAGEDPRPALGVEFAVGRWVHPGLLSPKQTDPITDSWIIAPEYLAPDTLTFSPDEAQFVIENFHGTRLTPASLQNIDRQLTVRGASLLHFICHGVSEKTRQILKLDPDEQLTDNQLRGLLGVTRAFRTHKPFVFINACQVGQVVPALAGSTGFAAVFTAMGARGVVAPIWSVRDSIAAQVAREFYTRIKADPTVPYAKVLQDIRKLAYDGDDPEDSYAAYCFYGDPNSAQMAAATG